MSASRKCIPFVCVTVLFYHLVEYAVIVVTAAAGVGIAKMQNTHGNKQR